MYNKKKKLILTVFTIIVLSIIINIFYNHMPLYSNNEYYEAEKLAIQMWKQTKYYRDSDIKNIDTKKENYMYYIYIETKDNTKHKLSVDMRSKNQEDQYNQIKIY